MQCIRRGSSNSSLKQLKQLQNKTIPIQISIEVWNDAFFEIGTWLDIIIDFDLVKDTREEVVVDLMRELNLDDPEIKIALCSELKQILTEKDILAWSQ